MAGLINQDFTNRQTPPTEADFEAPPGIIPGRRLPDHCYMDDDAQVERFLAVKPPKKAPRGVPTPAKAGKSPGRGAQARESAKLADKEHSLFDFYP